MDASPSFDAFARTFEAGQAQCLWLRRVADTETPVSAMLKIGLDGPPSFLLESVEGGAVRGRYSLIGLAPDLIWRAQGTRCEVARDALNAPEAFTPLPGAPLDELRALIAACRMDVPDALPRALAMLVGYMSYETINLVERLPSPRADPLGLPDLFFIRPTVLLVFDRLKDELFLIAPVYPDSAATDARAAYDQARDRLHAVAARLDRPMPPSRLDAGAVPDVAVTPQLAPGRYGEMVARAKEYIAAGDIFQVVLAQRFSTPFTLPPIELYRALRRINPSPFLYFLNLPGFAVIGSSPEILVRVRDGDVTVRPIAGTRPRGATAEEDEANRESLLADPKELAEHLMLLDLGRNDVGRVAATGTVKVTEKFTIEMYSHVMHIVSNVRGRLSPDHDAVDALMAGFPAGTVSGAPKVRAMEIINELEPEKRGPYAGGVGYFSADGSMDSCIVLRTAIVKDGMMHVQAGAGIVADSDPAAEQRECEAKSGALVSAAREAVRLAREGRYGQ